MRRSSRVLTIMAAEVVAAIGLTAPAHAGTAPVLQFAAGPAPDYGSVAAGASPERTFTLTNIGGTATASLKVALSPGTAFAITPGGDTCTAVSLGPKKTCTIAVRYTSAAAGANDTATLTASAKKPAAPASLILTGTSPTPLSQGCARMNALSTVAGGFVYTFNAGEVATLTATSGTLPLYVQLPDEPSDTLMGTVTAPDSLSYSILVTGVYFIRTVRSTGATFFWSCALAH